MQLLGSKSILKYLGEEKTAASSSDALDIKRVVCKRVAASFIIIVLLLTSVVIRLLVPMPQNPFVGFNSVNITTPANFTLADTEIAYRDN